MSDLLVDTDLHTPDGGSISSNGTLDVASQALGYDLTATLTAFNLSVVESKAPVTSLTGNVSAVGRGTDLPTLTSKVAADLSSSHVIHGADSIAVDTLSVRATAANGDAHVERLFATGAQTRATASGGFGLVSNRIDSLSYAVVVDSLGALNRWLPKSSDSTSVPPRPAVVARILAEARADSVRTAKRTEMERMILGGRPRVVGTPRPVPRERWWDDCISPERCAGTSAPSSCAGGPRATRSSLAATRCGTSRAHTRGRADEKPLPRFRYPPTQCK